MLRKYWFSWSPGIDKDENRYFTYKALFNFLGLFWLAYIGLAILSSLIERFFPIEIVSDLFPITIFPVFFILMGLFALSKGVNIPKWFSFVTLILLVIVWIICSELYLNLIQKTIPMSLMPDHWEWECVTWLDGCGDKYNFQQI